MSRLIIIIPILLTLLATVACYKFQEKKSINQVEIEVDLTEAQKIIDQKARNIFKFPPMFFKVNNNFVIYYPMNSEVYIIDENGKIIFEKFYGKQLNPNTIIDYTRNAAVFEENLFLLSYDHIIRLNTKTFEEKLFPFEFVNSPKFYSHFIFLNQDEFFLGLDEGSKPNVNYFLFKGNLDNGNIELLHKENVGIVDIPYFALNGYMGYLLAVRFDEFKFRFMNFSGSIEKEVAFEPPSDYKMSSSQILTLDEWKKTPGLTYKDKYTGIDLIDNKLYLGYKLFPDDVKNKSKHTSYIMVFDLETKIKKEFQLDDTFYGFAGNGQYFQLIEIDGKKILKLKILNKDFQ